jgi:hypothetical protein
MYSWTCETIQYAIEFVEEIRTTPAEFRDASLETFHRELIELQAIHEARIEAKEQRERIRSLFRRAISRIRAAVNAYRLEIDAV